MPVVLPPVQPTCDLQEAPCGQLSEEDLELKVDSCCITAPLWDMVDGNSEGKSWQVAPWAVHLVGSLLGRKNGPDG